MSFQRIEEEQDQIRCAIAALGGEGGGGGERGAGVDQQSAEKVREENESGSSTTQYV